LVDDRMVRGVHSCVYGIASWEEAMVEMNRHHHGEAEGEKRLDEPSDLGTAAIAWTGHRCAF